MLKSNFEKHLDEVCQKAGAEWNLKNGSVVIRRNGHKSIEFKAYGLTHGVNLERNGEIIELRWPTASNPAGAGLDVLGPMVMGMQQEGWQLTAQSLALMAFRDTYPETADWKEKLNREVRDLLEVFPEFENEDGKLAPCPSYWMAVSDLGWFNAMAISLNGELPHSLANMIQTVREEFEKTIPLGLPLSKPASGWVSRAQGHYLLKWLREDVTRLMFIWDGKVEPEVLSSAVAKLTKEEFATLVEPIKALHKSDPAKLRKMLPGFGF